MVERIPTGIKGFDELIEGGLPKGSVTLVAGTPGTGKSIFCSQIAYNNALKGKKCLYLNLEQDEGKLEGQMRDFGLSVDKIKKNMKMLSVDASNPDVIEYILAEIQKLTYDFIVLDSLDSISSNPADISDLIKLGATSTNDMVSTMISGAPTIGRMKLKKIFQAISKSGATALVTSERVRNSPGITRDTISEFLCDTIILLYYLGVGSSEFRSMKIIKMRRSNHEKGYIAFEIGKNGIELRKEKPI